MLNIPFYVFFIVGQRLIISSLATFKDGEPVACRNTAHCMRDTQSRINIPICLDTATQECIQAIRICKSCLCSTVEKCIGSNSKEDIRRIRKKRQYYSYFDSSFDRGLDNFGSSFGNFDSSFDRGRDNFGSSFDRNFDTFGSSFNRGLDNFGSSFDNFGSSFERNPFPGSLFTENFGTQNLDGANRWPPVIQGSPSVPRFFYNTNQVGNDCELENEGNGFFECIRSNGVKRCDVTCDNVFSGQYTCYSGRSWSPPLPRCVRPMGGNVETPPPRMPMPDFSNIGNIPSCRCFNGRSCDRNGNCVCPEGRTGVFCENTVSQKNSCSDPGFVTNGYRRDTGGPLSGTTRRYQDGESVVYSCTTDGYALQGASHISCRDGTWSNPPPRCIQTVVNTTEVLCPDPGQVLNADRLNSNGNPSLGVQQYKVGQSLVYTCRPGFVLQRRSLITCEPSGIWSNSLPYCTPKQEPSPTTASPGETPEYCDNPGEIANGKVLHVPLIDSREIPQSTATESDYPVGTKLQYLCDSGYTLEGDSTLTCEDSGNWSEDPPSCKLPYCEHPGDIDNGQILQVSNIDLDQPDKPQPIPSTASDAEYPVGTQLQYLCNSGYTLDGESIITCENTENWSDGPPTCKES